MLLLRMTDLPCPVVSVEPGDHCEGGYDRGQEGVVQHQPSHSTVVRSGEDFLSVIIVP